MLRTLLNSLSSISLAPAAVMTARRACISTATFVFDLIQSTTQEPGSSTLRESLQEESSFADVAEPILI